MQKVAVSAKAVNVLVQVSVVDATAKKTITCKNLNPAFEKDIKFNLVKPK